MKELLTELMDFGLLKRPGKCSKCRYPRQLGKNSHYKEGYAIRYKCKYMKSIKDCGFFTETQIPIKKYLEKMFCWANEIDQKDYVKQTGVSRMSVNQIYRYIREVASWKLLLSEELFKFGGPGLVVQIDESVVAKRKYNRGRVEKEKWVLGIYDTELKRGVVTYVEKRDAATILPVVKQHVLKWTEIWTDCWKAYNRLTTMGYINKKVNHSKTFKDPVTGVCTHGIEGTWGAMKGYLMKRSVMSINLPEHIDDYKWRMCFIKNNTSVLQSVMEHIKKRYPRWISIR